METIFQQILFGISVGATYALVALGFSMQFRAMGILNFAHGESFMMGAFIGLCGFLLMLVEPRHSPEFVLSLCSALIGGALMLGVMIVLRLSR